MKSWVLFLGILLLAGIFRLTLLQYAEFKGDEALNLLIATRPLFHHPFPPAGVTSSAGILNFPLINYLLLPITFFTLYPPSISFVIAIINTLAIGGFFLLFSKYHGRLTGLMASCIIATSPWAILYSRKIWAQDFLLPISLFFFLSVYKIIENKKNYWLLFGFSSMLLMQMHQIAVLFPILMVISFIKNARRAWKLLFAGILLGFIPAIPYIWYSTANMCITCQNTSLAARFSFHSLASFIRPLQILSTGNFFTEFGKDYAIFASVFPFAYKLTRFTYISSLAIPIGAYVFWLQSKKYRFFVLVCIAYILLLFAGGIEPRMHYYILLIPLFALFISWLFVFLMQKKYLLYPCLGIFCLYIVSLVSFDTGFLLFLSQKHGLSGDYGAGYISNEPSVRSVLRPYWSSKNYDEIELMYQSPIDYFHGYMPIAKMLFPFNQLQKNKLETEKKFIHDPHNPILLAEVFAYYTQDENPSWDYIVGMNEKARQQPAFSFVYNALGDTYLYTHLKHMYETPDFDLLYPQHWLQTQTEDGDIFSDGNMTFEVKRVATPSVVTIPSTFSTVKLQVHGIQLEKGTCKTANNKWCGTIYQPIFLRSQYYSFTALPTDAIGASYGDKVSEDVMTSIRVLQ